MPHTRIITVAANYIYFLIIIAFWFVKYVFRSVGTLSLKILLCIVFTDQIDHYGKFTALHKLISIVLQLTNQIK